MDERICSRCGISKPVTDFAKNQRWCKLCKHLLYRDGYAPKLKERTKSNRLQLAALMVDTKLTSGCCVCGYNRCARSLHFHHRDPHTKEFGVGDAVARNMSVRRIKQEISKCVVVCSNCHGEIHEGMVTI